MRKAPPPLLKATKGNLHTFPSPTDNAMQDIRNSTPFDHCCRWGPDSSSPAVVTFSSYKIYITHWKCFQV
jgi:hypothetical protein